MSILVKLEKKVEVHLSLVVKENEEEHAYIAVKENGGSQFVKKTGRNILCTCRRKRKNTNNLL